MKRRISLKIHPAKRTPSTLKTTKYQRLCFLQRISNPDHTLLKKTYTTNPWREMLLKLWKVSQKRKKKFPPASTPTPEAKNCPFQPSKTSFLSEVSIPQPFSPRFSRKTSFHLHLHFHPSIPLTTISNLSRLFPFQIRVSVLGFGFSFFFF